MNQEKNQEKLAEILGPHFNNIANDGLLVLRELGLPKGAKVLDVGTGACNFAIFLASQGFDVLTGEPATDTTHYAGKDWAASAEKAGVRDKIRFEAFNASKAPFETGTFDAVFFFGVLHHVDEGERAATLSEALRVAKKSGAVVFFEPRKETLEKLWVSDPTHPLAANPSEYLTDKSVTEQKLQGAMMDVFVYRKG